MNSPALFPHLAFLFSPFAVFIHRLLTLRILRNLSCYTILFSLPPLPSLSPPVYLPTPPPRLYFLSPVHLSLTSLTLFFPAYSNSPPPSPVSLLLHSILLHLPPSRHLSSLPGRNAKFIFRGISSDGNGSVSPTACVNIFWHRNPTARK